MTGLGGDSLWLAGAPPTAYPALEGDAEFDVAVIGGGIAGVNAALLLKRDGARVAVLERGVVCGGATAPMPSIEATALPVAALIAVIWWPISCMAFAVCAASCLASLAAAAKLLPASPA